MQELAKNYNISYLHPNKTQAAEEIKTANDQLRTKMVLENTEEEEMLSPHNNLDIPDNISSIKMNQSQTQ